MAVSAWLAPAVVSAQEDTSPHSTVDLVPISFRLKSNDLMTVGLRFRLDPGWHIYWKNPGDAGMPPVVDWTLPAGFKIAGTSWPIPHRVSVGGIVSYAHEGTPTLLVDIRLPKGFEPGAAIPISAQINYLICEELCLTASESVSATFDIDSFPKGPPLAPLRDYPIITSLDRLDFSQQEGTVELGIELGSVLLADVKKAYFFAVGEDVIDHAAEQKWRIHGKVITVTARISKYANGRIKKPEGVLVVQLKDRTVAIEFKKQQDSQK
ncbi:MAG: hypothetical protein IH944_01355 [Armatimonadetes bacterium]|nr:hypothetical protein [Armatimonadota bacterium]